MSEAFDAAAYVRQASAAVGLPIAADDFDSVVSAFAVLARVAGAVLAVPLPEDVVAAAVFSPHDGGAA